MKKQEYTPSSIDVSDVQLPEELKKLSELLAKNVHETWPETRMKEGWRFEPERNDCRKWCVGPTGIILLPPLMSSPVLIKSYPVKQRRASRCVVMLNMYMFHITPYRVKVSSFPTLINNSTDIRKEQFTGVSRTGRYVWLKRRISRDAILSLHGLVLICVSMIANIIVATSSIGIGKIIYTDLK